MAKRIRIDDLEAWARRKSSAYETIGKPVADGVRRGAFVLLKEGIRHAPKHTGALRRSLRVLDRMRADGSVELSLQSADPAAGMQQDGGILLARRRLMTVPIGSERAYWDATGTRREPKSITGLFKIKARDGREYLVTRAGRQIVLRFALRRRVRQEGQGWATAAVRAAGPQLDGGIAAEVMDYLLATDRAGPV